MSSRFHLRTALAGLLTVALLAIFFRNADFGQVWDEMREARIDLLLAALGVTALTYIVRALRWQYLLEPLGPTRFSAAFRTTVIGFAATFLLPARAGEFLRPYLLARWEQLSATASFATIILERLFDLLTVLLLFGLFVLLFDPGMVAEDARTYEAIQWGGLAAAVGAVVALVIVFAIAGRPDAFGRAARSVERLLPARLAEKFAGLVQTFVEGLAVMRRPRPLLMTLVLSFPLWLCIALGIWFVARAFHMTVPFTGSFLLMALLVVGVSVPTPGAVGGFHEAFRLGATVFYGVANDRAVGAAIVLHALSFVPVTLLGILFMAQAGLSREGLRRLAEEKSGARDAAPGTVTRRATPPAPALRPVDDKGSAG